MFTQPNAEYLFTSFNDDGTVVQEWKPVPPNLWGYFAPAVDAVKFMHNYVNPIVSDGKILDGLGLDLFIPVRYTGNKDQKIWVVHGTVQMNGQTWLVDEYLGQLMDRQVKPNPFIDKSPVKGLIAVPIYVDGVATGIAQLQWTNQ